MNGPLFFEVQVGLQYRLVFWSVDRSTGRGIPSRGHEINPGFCTGRKRARFNADSQAQQRRCNHGQLFDDGEAQCGGGGWVPKRLICRCRRVPPRITRSTRGAITRIQRDNTDVAANASAARDAKAKLPSPPGTEKRGAPAEVSHTRKTPARTRQEASPASSGNHGVADEASGNLATPPLAPTPTPPAAIGEEVVAQLAAKEAEIRALKAQLEESTRQAEVDKHREQPNQSINQVPFN